MNEPQQGIRASREAHACYQALACFPAERKANEREDISESHGAPGIGSHDAGEAFGEDLPRTLLVGAKEAAHM
jgi:hypothetical protein